MSRYPDETMSLGQLFTRSVALHYRTFKHAVFFILLFALVKDGGYFLSTLSENTYLQLGIAIIAFLVLILLLGCLFKSADIAISGDRQQFTSVLADTLKNYHVLLICLVLYVLGIVIAQYFSYFVRDILAQMFPHDEKTLHLTVFMLGIALIFLFLGMFAYAFPLCATGKAKTLGKAFYDSLILTVTNKFGVIVFFALSFMLFVLVSPTTLHEYYLATYHLSLLFDLVVLSVVMPIMINFLLLLINDSRLQVHFDEE